MNKLIKMIIESQAIDTQEEKQQRINLLDKMLPEHIERLEEILTREKKKLKEIQDKYDRKKKEIIKKTIKENNLTSIMAM